MASDLLGESIHLPITLRNKMKNLYLEENLELPTKDILSHIQKRIMTQTSYFGVKTLKNPLDFWLYQEIIFDMKPDYIIEIGNNWGGSTLALAHLLDLMNKGSIIAIDIDHSKIHKSVKNHSRITLIENDAVSAFEKVKSIIKANSKVLVIEDSSHTFENTLNVLNLYSTFTQLNDYFIVEDSICHHGLNVGPSPGPYEAVEAFTQANSSFEIDRDKEGFFITWNPKGFLKRIK